MERKPNNARKVTVEDQIQQIQRLCSDLSKAIDASAEQRRILRDLARKAERLVASLESAATHNHTLTRRRASRKKR